MKLCVIVPSQDYLGLAGVRIRYLRIADRLADAGHTLSIEVIDQFRSADQFSADVYLFSKCYDARCHVVCQLLKESDKLVGIDMFDDYFSQHDDSRFVCHRDWLRAMEGRIDFCLCSTGRMRDVVAGYMPDTPAHILNDPFDRASRQSIERGLAVNLERTLFSRRIEIGWFGVGDNPHFAVGLHDLVAFAPALARLQRDGWTVALRILTNRRALSPSGLEMLGRLPVQWSLDEWSIPAENALLASCLVAFIPVNAQPFSIAKSLNRAVSALSAGTQILSTGYPLYAPLDSFIYRRPEALLDDLATQRLLLRDDTVPALLELLAAYGDPAREAASCAAFLTALAAAKRERRAAAVAGVETPQRLGVVHGVRSQGAVHQLAQRTRQLSIGSPFSNPGLNYDLRFDRDDRGALRAWLSEAAAAHVGAQHQKQLTPALSPSGRRVKVLDASSVAPDAAAAVLRGMASRTRAEQLASYAPAMAAVRTLAQALLPRTETRVSENEAPYSVPGVRS